MSLLIRLKLWRKKIVLTWRFRFAHHPLCSRYRDQVFVIGGVYLCQGCTLTYIGLILGAILFTFLPINLRVWEWIIVGSSFALPTFIVQLFRLPRLIKRGARFLNGIGLGAMIVAVFKLSSWLDRLIIVGITVLVYFIFRFVHGRAKKERDLCTECSELNEPRVCTGYKLRAEAERKYSEYASELFGPLIEAYVQSKWTALDESFTVNPPNNVRSLTTDEPSELNFSESKQE